MSDEAIVRFVASLAAVMHPIKSGRDGARITIDVPLSERLEVMKLELMTDMAFEVTIRPVVIRVEEGLSNGGAEADNRTARRPTEVAGSRVQRPTD